MRSKSKYMNFQSVDIGIEQGINWVAHKKDLVAADSPAAFVTFLWQKKL
jgi:hypothetical protein